MPGATILAGTATVIPYLVFEPHGSTELNEGFNDIKTLHASKDIHSQLLSTQLRKFSFSTIHHLRLRRTLNVLVLKHYLTTVVTIGGHGT